MSDIKNTPDDYRDQFKALDKRLDFQGPEAIATDTLECFDYKYRERDIDIVTSTEEFTSVCPFSGLPDFGRISITYTPNEKCVELRSLKYYLLSFRNVGMFYEHLANRIMDDMVALMDPKHIEVVCEMTPRGGLSTTIKCEHTKE